MSKEKYKLPSNESEHLSYIYDLMDIAEQQTHNELSMTINRVYTGDFHLEVYEYPELEDDEMELVDWYTGKTLEDMFNYLMERYL